ncbi:MAG: hypothetical protein IPH16_09830 [Haliscomenobacter sp.]|nr:hypothetical protein [Haliscomenobacter sp.]
MRKNQEEISFDPKALKDFHFRFDIGLAPEFEVNGLDASTHFEQPVVDVTDEMVGEDVLSLRRRLGERSNPESDFQQGDLIALNAVELNDDGSVKAEGHSSSFSLLFEDATPEAQQALAGLKTGDSFPFDVYQLEKDRDEAFVRRYLLHLDPEEVKDPGRLFQLTIDKAERNALAEMNQEFFDRAFEDGEVHSEAELRERITQGIGNFYKAQSDALLFKDFQERLLELNQLPLPDDFLRRWIRISNENADEKLVEKEYPLFARNLQWTLIRNKIARQFNLQVTEDEIVEHFTNRVRGYFGSGVASLGEEFIQNMARRLMQDEKQVEQAYDDLLTDRLHDAVRSVVTVSEKKLSLADFSELAEKARAEAQAHRHSLLPDDEEE